MNEKAKQKARELVEKFYKKQVEVLESRWIAPLEVAEHEIAKECAKIAVNLQYDAKVDAFNQMSEFQPDIAAQAVFYANQEREQVLTEIDNL